MTTKSQNRMLGLTLVALLATIGGELLGIRLLVTVSVTSFFLAIAGLFAIMAVTLTIGVSQTSGPDMHNPVSTD